MKWDEQHRFLLTRRSVVRNAPEESRVYGLSRKESCARRARFAEALAQAVSNMFARDREYQGAKERKENTFEFSLALENARAAERAAVDAYDGHIRQHRCRS